jgi:hypothetical protein
MGGEGTAARRPGGPTGPRKETDGRHDNPRQDPHRGFTCERRRTRPANAGPATHGGRARGRGSGWAWAWACDRAWDCERGHAGIRTRNHARNRSPNPVLGGTTGAALVRLGPDLGLRGPGRRHRPGVHVGRGTVRLVLVSHRPIRPCGTHDRLGSPCGPSTTDHEDITSINIEWIGSGPGRHCTGGDFAQPVARGPRSISDCVRLQFHERGRADRGSLRRHRRGNRLPGPDLVHRRRTDPGWRTTDSAGHGHLRIRDLGRVDFHLQVN